MFVIEDEAHAESQAGQFATWAEAMDELRRRAIIPWDHDPNRAPCTNWRNCGRRYEIIELDDSGGYLAERSRRLVLEISCNGVIWRVD